MPKVRDQIWIRTAELKPVHADPHPSLITWLGTWRMLHYEDVVHIHPSNKDGWLALDGKATWTWTDGKGQNFGEFQGKAKPAANKLHFGDEPGCVVDLTLIQSYMIVDDNNGCGGMNVTFRGIYRRTTLNK